jgi:hypothetical protein
MNEEGGIILALTLLRLFRRLKEVRRYDPFENMSPWLSVDVILTDNNRVRQNLAELGESMYMHSRGVGLRRSPAVWLSDCSPRIHSGDTDGSEGTESVQGFYCTLALDSRPGDSLDRSFRKIPG